MPSNPSWFTKITALRMAATGSSPVTAHAGGGQSSAFPFVKGVNQVGTAATSGDSVALPVAAAGALILVINTGANPVAVFPNGTDTINGQAASASVSQMPNSVALYVSPANGNWFAIGLGTGFNGSLETASNLNGLTAHAGGGQASAVALTTMISRVTTVGSANDSVVLPPAIPGMTMWVKNAAAANSLNVFPASATQGGVSGGDAINALSQNSAFAVAANKAAQFTCAALGTWDAILTA